MSDEILQELRAIRTEQTNHAVNMARVETKVDDLRTAKSDHDKRITSLEHVRTKVGAYVAVLALVLSVVVGFAKDAIAATFFNH